MRLFPGFLLCMITNYTKTNLKWVLADACSGLIFAGSINCGLSGKRQEAKRQEARGKRQGARGKEQQTIINN